jgi:hypothetical protein
MSFKAIANNITVYFESFVNDKKLTVRYDNDPRDTPASGLWCRLKIEFDESNNKEIGNSNSYRNTGNVIIEVYNDINMGLAPILNTIDSIVLYFAEKIVSTIRFLTPSINNNGRENDNYKMSIVCPFYIDN